MLTVENSYGVIKRLNFLKEVIEIYHPESVLDIGCGAGTYLTLPLAKSNPAIRFLGADTDLASIEFAQNNNNLDNLSFCISEHIGRKEKFDLIIASEVIEHVESPEEFIIQLKEKLTDKGTLVFTVPNGYGPFETTCLLESILYFLGIFTLLRKLRKIAWPDARDLLLRNVGTLAVSPHINFFSYSQIKRLILNAGFKIIKYQPRTFLCGFGFDQLLRGSRLLAWNARFADYLPPFMNSDWMFVLESGGQDQKAGYRRNRYAKIRRFLNEKRSGLREKEKQFVSNESTLAKNLGVIWR
jgi:SAM-dependent methyltransferase